MNWDPKSPKSNTRGNKRRKEFDALNRPDQQINSPNNTKTADIAIPNMNHADAQHTARPALYVAELILCAGVLEWKEKGVKKSKTEKPRVGHNMHQDSEEREVWRKVSDSVCSVKLWS